MSRKKSLPNQAVILKGLRGREGFTQNELAKKLQLSKSTISNIETGKREISPNEAKKLAQILSTKSKMFKK